jgi:hypothetical protein
MKLGKPFNLTLNLNHNLNPLPEIKSKITIRIKNGESS